MTRLRVVTGFEGANPRLPEHVREEPDGSFSLFPEHEPDTPPGYRFRLDTDLENPGPAPREAVLRVCWDDSRYAALRRTIYVRNGGGGFAPVLGAPGRETGEVLFRFLASPGRTEVSLLPRYGAADMDALEQACAGTLGFSLLRFPMEGGPLRVFSFSPGPPRPSILATGRIHPYETAGSFCVDAMVRALVRNPEYRRRALARFDLLLAPVMSPAGVGLGFCRRNGAGGAGIDLAREWEHKDPVCEAVAALRDEREIAGLLDVHNWMHPDRDGIKFVGRLTAARFRTGLGDARGKGRRLKGIFRRRLFAHRPNGVGGFLRSRGAFCLMVEYPWAGRTGADMARLGEKSLTAFLRLLPQGRRP